MQTNVFWLCAEGHRYHPDDMQRKTGRILQQEIRNPIYDVDPSQWYTLGEREPRVIGYEPSTLRDYEEYELRPEFRYESA